MTAELEKRTSSQQNSFLFKTLIIYFIGTFVSKAASFFLLPLVTNNISTADYGNFDLIQSIILVLTPVFSLQIVEALYRFLIKASPQEEKTIYFDSFLVIFIGIALCAVTFAIVDSFFYKIPCCWLTFSYYCATIILNAFQRVARSKNYSKTFAFSGIIDTFSMIAIQSVTLLVFKMSIEGLLLGYIAGASFGAIFIAIRVRIFHNFSFRNFSWPKLKELIRYSAPLIPNNIAWWVAELINKLFIIYYISQEAQGIYAITAKFTSVLILFTDVFKLSWTETAVHYYDGHDQHDNYYSQAFSRFVRVLILGCSAVIPFILLIFPRFIGSNYQGALQYIPLAMYASCLSSIVSFYGSGYAASKKTGGAFFTSIIGMALNVGLCWALVVPLGLYAVPVSSLLAYLVIWVIRQQTMKRFFPIHINYLEIFSLLLVSVATTCVFYFGGKTVNIVFLIFIIALFLVCNIRILTYSLNKVFPKVPIIGVLELVSLTRRYLRGNANFFRFLFVCYYPLAFFSYFLLVFFTSIHVGIINGIIIILFSPLVFSLIFSKRPSFTDCCVIFYFLYSAFTIIFLPSNDLPFSVGVKEFSSCILPVFFLFIAKKFHSKETVDFFWTFLLCSCVFCFSCGYIWTILTPNYYFSFLKVLLNNIFAIEHWTYEPRLTSFLGSTEVGLFSSVAVFVSYWMLVSKKRIFYFFLMAFFIVSSFLSYQRVSYIMTFLAILALSTYFFIKEKWFRKFILIGAGSFLLIVLAVFLIKPLFFDNILERISAIPTAFYERRMDYVAPFLFGEQILYGRGLGSFSHHALGYGVLTITDCAFTKTLGEVGLIGFLPFLVVLVKTFQTFAHSKNKSDLILPFGVFLLFCIVSLGSNGFCYQILAPLFWSSIGFVLADDSIPEKKKSVGRKQ